VKLNNNLNKDGDSDNPVMKDKIASWPISKKKLYLSKKKFNISRKLIRYNMKYLLEKNKMFLTSSNRK